jgi:hypothetical protein
MSIHPNSLDGQNAQLRGHWAEWLISMVKEGEADTHLEITIVSG